MGIVVAETMGGWFFGCELLEDLPLSMQLKFQYCALGALFPYNCYILLNGGLAGASRHATDVVAARDVSNGGLRSAVARGRAGMPAGWYAVGGHSRPGRWEVRLC